MYTYYFMLLIYLLTFLYFDVLKNHISEILINHIYEITYYVSERINHDAI